MSIYNGYSEEFRANSNDEILEEALKLSLTGQGNCDVMTFGGEEENPHFHILSKKNKELNCCIYLDKAEFYSHDKHRVVLGGKQIKEISEWLDEKCKADNTMTNYEYLRDQWNKRNFGFEINDDIPKPNYLDLKEWRKNNAKISKKK